jgi:hypothetical protein
VVPFLVRSINPALFPAPANDNPSANLADFMPSREQ